MPENTLDATIDHGEIRGDSLSGTAEDARAVFAGLDAVGVNLAEVWTVLEDEGVEKFVDSWNELLDTLSAQLEAK